LVLYEKESYEIRGAVFDVYKELGCGHKESVYQKALLKSLIDRKLKAEREKRLDVFFKKEKVGTYVPDFLVNNEIIMEVKAKPEIKKQDVEQFWHYLTSTNYKLGFLVNFGKAGGVQIVRRVYDLSRNKNAFSSASNSASFRVIHGYVALMSLLVVGAAGLAVSISLILFGVGSTRSSFVIEQSGQSKNIANACAEEALKKIRNSLAYTGNGNLTLGQGTCSYAVSAGSGQARTITVSATAGTAPRTITRKIQISISQITPRINVSSWQEIP